MGNIVSVSRDGKQKKAYTYDALNRIISEKDIDNEQEICYTYDNNGNILTKSVNGVVTSYAYEEGTDRLTSYGAETIGYDGMGNPKSYRGSELTWEKGRRLTSIKEGPEEVTFGYDVFGQRNKKTAGGETTNYIYENGKLLRQITGSEVMTFIYGSEGIIGFKLGTSRYLYRKNVFGDVEEIYNEGGTLVGKYNYTAFGECEIETDANGIATKNPIRYRGYYFDEETGFYYLKTRYYDPETGRFITIDDVSYLAPDTINGLNLYAYCGNNPVMRVDANGNAWWNPFSWDWGAIGEIIIGAVVSTLGSGFVFQVAVSTISYVGMAIGAIFSKDIRNDMNRIHWNPFNSNEELVLESKYVSFYKGAPIFRLQKSRDQARPGSFFGILLPKGSSIDDVRHEWGHILQLIIMGFIFYGSTVAIPSICEWGEWGNYYDAPWETLADMFGGVVSREHTPEQKKRAIKYFLLSYFFGCLAYFMVK